MSKGKISTILQKHLARLRLRNFFQRMNVLRLFNLPSLHKRAALIMLLPFIFHMLMQDVFVISKLEISIPKFFSRIPLLEHVDLSFLPFFDTEFVIENINYSILVFLPVFLLAVMVSQWMISRRSSRQTIRIIEEKQTRKAHTEGLEDLNREVMPIWNRQIESARKQSEVAVKDLAKQFGGISRRLHESIAASVSYANDGASKIGNRDAGATGMISQAELGEMLDTLKEAIDVKSVLLDKINQLKEQTNVMKEVVSAVKAVSRRTEVLAINAAIESRRAGVHGRSFGIVANEVRKLSEQSEEMVDDVGHRIQMLEQKMDEVIAQTNINTNGPQDLENQSSNTMSMYERLRMLAMSLSKSSEILLVESKNIKSEINEILVALQYQDKTSQILIHVTNDVDALVNFLQENARGGVRERLDVDVWLEKLYSTYTMIEEKRAHTGEEQNFEQPPEEDSGSLEFF